MALDLYFDLCYDNHTKLVNINSERSSDMSTRTTVTMDKHILEDCKKVAKNNNETLTDFLNRACLNQIEKEADFDTRYSVRGEEDD